MQTYLLKHEDLSKESWRETNTPAKNSKSQWFAVGEMSGGFLSLLCYHLCPLEQNCFAEVPERKLSTWKEQSTQINKVKLCVKRKYNTYILFWIDMFSQAFVASDVILCWNCFPYFREIYILTDWPQWLNMHINERPRNIEQTKIH